MMLKTELLETLVAIAEHGNFSKAAEKVCRTQSTLSLQVKKLEDIVGQTLFTRDSKGAELTDAGNTLLSYARKMLQLNYRALEELRGGKSKEIIRLGLPTDYVEKYLRSCLLDFVRQFTFIELLVDTDVSGNLYKRLEQDEFDLVIGTHWEKQAESIFLFERKFHWISAKNSLVHLSDELPVALYPENCPIRAQVFANHQLNMRPINIILSTPSPEALCMAVESGIAIAPVSEFRINDKMMILDPEVHNLPKLPTFNESLYVNKNCTSAGLIPLLELIHAYVENFE